MDHQFVVLFVSSAGALTAEGHRLEIRQIPTAMGFTDLVIRTRWASTPTENVSLPRELEWQFSLSAQDASQATTLVGHIPVVFSHIYALDTNAWAAAPRFKLTFDATPGLSERFFCQDFVEPYQSPQSFRLHNLSRFLPIANAIGVHLGSKRLSRAIEHYSHSLSMWSPGWEVLALAYLYAAAEALSKLVKERERARTRLTDAELARSWGIDLHGQSMLTGEASKKFESAVRERLIFRGDEQTYKAAKEARNGFQHGYMDAETLRAHALAAIHQTAAYVRTAIVDECHVDKVVREQLLSSPYDTPLGAFPFTDSVSGILIGPFDESPTANGEDYPFMAETQRTRERLTAPSGDVRLRAGLRFTPRINPSFRFSVQRTDSWGPVTPTERGGGLVT